MSNNIDPKLAAVLAPLSEMKITGQRIRNAIQNEGIVSLNDLLNMTEVQFLRIPNFGYKSLRALQACLAKHGLHLNGAIEAINDQSLLDSMRCRADNAMRMAVMMQEAVDRLEAAIDLKKATNK